MRRLQVPTLLLALAMTAALAFPAMARHPASVELGTERVGAELETDVIRVDRDYGRVSWLRVIPKRNGIYLRRVIVTFGNRTTQIFNVDDLIDAGEQSRTLEFKGGRRNLSKVALEYVARPIQNRSAIVTVVTDTPTRRKVRDLEVIGEGSVRPRRRSVIIPVGRDAGRFSGIAIRTRNRPARIENIEIEFANGDVQKVAIDQRLRPRTRTGIIQFNRRGRKIDNVRVNIIPIFRRRTTGLQIIGQPAGRWQAEQPPPRKQEKWVHLGTRKVSLFNKDTDVFRIGRQHGRFSAIRVTAKRHDVRMYGMRITYGNGSIENVPLHGTIEDGHTTPPYDLKGRHRYIDHISFRYRTRLNFKGAAHLELWGLRTQKR